MSIAANQSVHVTVKTPANPQPQVTLGLFDQAENIPNLVDLIKFVIQGQKFEPKSSKFLQDAREEVMKALFQENAIVQSVARKDNILYITLKESK